MEQTNDNKQSLNPTTQCRNCESPFTSEVQYCPTCGQKNTDGKASIWEVLGVFFSTVFNLESKFFTTIRDIFIPGKLTRFYFKGKRGRHFHPMRLFIVTFLFLIAAIGLQISRDAKSEQNSFITEAQKNLSRQAFIEKMDSLSRVITAQYPENQDIQTAFDSLNTKFMADSIKDFGLDSFTVTLLTSQITGRDMLTLPVDTIIARHNVEGFVKQLFLRQSVKLLKDGKGFLSFLLSKAIWIVLAMMPFLALLFKLLYIRRSRYYVEHLIFSFHIHAFAFILFTISILLNVFAGISWGFVLSILAILLYIFFAMKRVYNQGFGKTFAKFFILIIAYLFIAALFLLMGLFISAALF